MICHEGTDSRVSEHQWPCQGHAEYAVSLPLAPEVRERIATRPPSILHFVCDEHAEPYRQGGLPAHKLPWLSQQQP